MNKHDYRYKKARKEWEDKNTYFEDGDQWIKQTSFAKEYFWPRKESGIKRLQSIYMAPYRATKYAVAHFNPVVKTMFEKEVESRIDDDVLFRAKELGAPMPIGVVQKKPLTTELAEKDYENKQKSRPGIIDYGKKAVNVAATAGALVGGTVGKVAGFANTAIKVGDIIVSDKNPNYPGNEFIHGFLKGGGSDYKVALAENEFNYNAKELWDVPRNDREYQDKLDMIDNIKGHISHEKGRNLKEKLTWTQNAIDAVTSGLQKVAKATSSYGGGGGGGGGGGSFSFRSNSRRRRRSYKRKYRRYNYRHKIRRGLRDEWKVRSGYLMHVKPGKRNLIKYYKRANYVYSNKRKKWVYAGTGWRRDGWS